MNKIFIHCGAAKTGTSYLQVLFARYCEKLADAGILYPVDDATEFAKTGAVTSGNGVELANYLRPNLPHRIPDKNSFPDKLNKILIDSKGKDILFSSEFIVFPRNDQTDKLVSIIDRAGYQPRIIYMVRDFAAAARSNYSQQVKRNGETRTFIDYLLDWEPHYHRHVQLQIDAFGKENLLLFNYGEHKNKLIELFFRKVFNTDFTVEGNFITNRSLTDKEIELCRLMNGLFPQNRRDFSTFVSDALMALPKDSSEIGATEEEFKILNSRFGKSLVFLNEHIRGQKLRITPKMVDDRADVHVGDFEAAMMAILARLIVRFHKPS